LLIHQHLDDATVPDPDQLAANLSRNLRSLREIRRYTQQRLSTLSGVPRPTLATLESGSANPTLAVLAKVAGALSVSIEELIGPPRDMGRLYLADSLPRRMKRGVELRDVVPDPLPGMTLERMALPPGGRLTGIPGTSHRAGQYPARLVRFCLRRGLHPQTPRYALTSSHRGTWWCTEGIRAMGMRIPERSRRSRLR
jgi:transcriptional regulator with XRE-family HTH domain